LLQFYIPELFHRLLSLSVEHSYILQRWIFVFLAFICFHKYLRKWFNQQESFSGVLLLAVISAFTYCNDLQESFPLLLLTFLLGLWAIRDNKIWLLITALLAGGLNNETILILPLAYLFYNYKGSKIKDIIVLCRNALLISLPMLLTVGSIRYINRNLPHAGGGLWQWLHNLYAIQRDLHANIFDYHQAYYLHVFFIFNVFWFYAFMRFKDRPLFLRRASLMIPFFILAHLITGIISEVRQMVPLAFIIIPMAFFYIYPSKQEVR
jgi:hypothetical protein